MNLEIMQTALTLRKIHELIISLDGETLKDALIALGQKYGTHESAAVLDPQPQTLEARLQLERLKVKQLSFYTQLYDNLQEIKTAEEKLREAEGGQNVTRKLFGL